MNGLRVGLAGCGRAATGLHVPAIGLVDGLRVTALADPDPGALDRARRGTPGVRAHAGGLDLANDPEVDVVAVCVPPSLHAEVAIAALRAGKHVYVEKPLAVTTDDAARIRAAAEASPGKLVLGFNLRSHRLVREARRLVAGGVLGPIEMLRTVFACDLGDLAGWRLDRSLGGGAFFEIAVHHLDLARFLLDDEIEAVTAAASAGDLVDRNVAISARMRSGVLVGIQVGQRTVESNEIEVFGRRGSLSLSCYRADSFEVRAAGDLDGRLGSRLRRPLARLRGLPAALDAARRGGDIRSSYAEHWRRFAAAILHGDPVPASLEDGERALVAVHAAIRSVETGATVRLPGGGAR